MTSQTSPLLTFQSVRKAFGSMQAVDGVSLDLCKGEIIGLIGPDGAGKTTAMRMACGLLVPDEGLIDLCGINPAKSPLRARAHLGYMPQRFSLYPDLTVAENLRFFADLYAVSAADREAREEWLMQFSRLAPFRTRRAGKLSGGMKQKLALSCTLIHQPEVLILDEPTTGVDPVSRQEFWSLLKDLSTEGHALLVSTPYMDEALRCDRIALMYRGVIIGKGTPAEVTGLFNRELAEVSGAALELARRKLARANPAWSINRFGDRLHIVFDQASDEQLIREMTREVNVEVQKVDPTIEDTFVSLMSEKAD